MNSCEGERSLIFANGFLPIEKWKNILYIGMCSKTLDEWDGDWFLRYISERNKSFKTTILERSLLNLNCIRSHNRLKPYHIEFVHEDITRYTDKLNQYDVIIWWHGPEHVSLQEFETFNKNIDPDKLVLIGCPLGYCEYVDVATEDMHKSDISVQFLENLNYKTIILDRNKYGNPQPAITGIRFN